MQEFTNTILHLLGGHQVSPCLHISLLLHMPHEIQHQEKPQAYWQPNITQTSCARMIKTQNTK